MEGARARECGGSQSLHKGHHAPARARAPVAFTLALYHQEPRARIPARPAALAQNDPKTNDIDGTALPPESKPRERAVPGHKKTALRLGGRLGTQNARRGSATSCSPTGYPAVPSALGGLTSGFGMGPGVPPLPWSLTHDGRSSGLPSGRALRAAQRGDSRRPSPLMTAHETRSSMRVRARPISAARLRRSHALHLPPIDLVVCQGPYRKENSSWDGLPA